MVLVLLQVLIVAQVLGLELLWALHRDVTIQACLSIGQEDLLQRLCDTTSVLEHLLFIVHREGCVPVPGALVVEPTDSL